MKPIDTDNSWWLPGGKGGGDSKGSVSGAKYKVTEDDLTSGGGHTMHCTDRVCWKCTPDTYIILLTPSP